MVATLVEKTETMMAAWKVDATAMMSAAQMAELLVAAMADDWACQMVVSKVVWTDMHLAVQTVVLMVENWDVMRAADMADAMDAAMVDETAATWGV